MVQLENRILQSRSDAVEGRTDAADNDLLGIGAIDDKAANQHLVVREDLKAGRDIQDVPGRGLVQTKDGAVTVTAARFRRPVEAVLGTLKGAAGILAGG